MPLRYHAEVPNPRLSIVIPTHKRANVLAKCLSHIEKQTIANELEVIVVSDGHDPETARLFENPAWKMPVKFLEIEKSQQGIARNRGVEEASADIVLFIGDDIFLAPDCCEKHLKAHVSHLTSQSYAVLGFTTWDPTVGITDEMLFLEKSGWQFGYGKIKKYAHDFLPPDVQHHFSYTSNISVPTAVARQHPFLSQVHLYGWEDIEWGKRKKEAGIRLYYEPDAKALHHHKITLEDSLKRMETLGKSLTHLEKIVPDLSLKPTGFKLTAYQIAAMLPTMAGKHRKAFLKGLRSP